MAIEVKHGLNAGAAAAAAFGGAQGQARSAAGRGAAAAGSRAAAAEKARAFQGEQAQLGRNFRNDQSTLRHQRGLESQQFNSGLQQDAAVAAQGRRRDDLEFSLTTKQRAELDQLAEAEAQAMGSSDFTDEEKGEIQRRLKAKRLGIKPVERPREQTAAEKFKQGTYTDPKTGSVFPIQKDGSFGRPLYEPPEKGATQADRAKFAQIAVSMATNAEGGIDDAKFQKAFQMLLNSGGAGAGAPGAQGGEPGQPAPGGQAGFQPALQPTIEQLGAEIGGFPLTRVSLDDPGVREALAAQRNAAPEEIQGGGGYDPHGGSSLVQFHRQSDNDVVDLSDRLMARDPEADEPRTPAQIVQEVRGGKVNPSVLEPSAVRNLPTLKFQIEAAEAKIETIKGEGAKLTKSDAESFARSVGPKNSPRAERQQARIARKRKEDLRMKVKEVTGRVKALNKRKTELLEEADMNEAKAFLRARRPQRKGAL